MRNSDEQEARTESERALQQVMFAIMSDNLELFKQFQDNPSFKKWLSNMVFNLTYEPNVDKKEKIVDYTQHKIPVGVVAEGATTYGGENK